MVKTSSENMFEVMYLTSDPAVWLWGIYPRDVKTYVHKKTLPGQGALSTSAVGIGGWWLTAAPSQETCPQLIGAISFKKFYLHTPRGQHNWWVIQGTEGSPLSQDNPRLDLRPHSYSASSVPYRLHLRAPEINYFHQNPGIRLCFWDQPRIAGHNSENFLYKNVLAFLFSH